MGRLFLTYVSFFVFLVTVFFVHYNAGAYVSPETSVDAYREMFNVKQGSGEDGQMTIKATQSGSLVPSMAKYSNHLRNLRVFVSSDRAGVPALYLEQAKPHAFFVIDGPFTAPPQNAHFLWTDSTTFLFYATGTDYILRRYSINIHTLSMQSELVTETPHDSATTTDTSDI